MEKTISISDKEMQREVLETEAAVDKCYWGRAKRAGLGGT